MQGFRIECRDLPFDHPDGLMSGMAEVTNMGDAYRLQTFKENPFGSVSVTASPREGCLTIHAPHKPDKETLAFVRGEIKKMFPGYSGVIEVISEAD